MRLLELEIRNIRGIRRLNLKPNGRNFLVWGPNGSGKSAVVDAIDFLLTGHISRLTGEGTGDVTLKKHGPHVDRKPEDTMVRAVVELPGLDDPVEIRRSIARPNDLECDEGMRERLDPILCLAQRKHHVLSRRDILRYIAADTSTRAGRIQELMNLSEVEDTRKALVRANNVLTNERKAATVALAKAMGAVNATTQEQTFEEEKVLQVVNQNRAVLGGEAISSVGWEDLKGGLTPRKVVSSAKALDVTLLDRYMANVRNVFLEERQTQVAAVDQELRSVIAAIRSDPKALRSLSRLPLTELGLKLIDASGSCPLCDKPWPPGELSEYLNNRLSAAEAATKHRKHIERLAKTAAASVDPTIVSLRKVAEMAQGLELKEEFLVLESWLKDLEELSGALSAPLEKYADSRFGPDGVKRMLAPQGVERNLVNVETALKAKYPEATPEQRAWDILTRLEENLKALQDARTSFNEAQLSETRAAVLHESFLTARDRVLAELYDRIRDRFVSLYGQLHRVDEGQFAATIEPEEAGLNLEVDFYGRGLHPPLALHSEGHQDSMGLCLYLALAEHLTKGIMDTIILDDVVMSIDTDHRRQICHLLATDFPDRQFVITTHDRTWANQLKSEGIVDSGGIIEFYKWDVESGPYVNIGAGLWERIEEDLGKNDVPSAAARLRRGMEEFLGAVCDALQAQVRYRVDGRWELGDFLPAAERRYRGLLKEAKNAAQSWGDEDGFRMLQELDSTRGQIYSRSGADQWGVNVNVHYNNWANFSPNDFRPLVEAFHDLYDLFLCSKCGGMLRLATTGVTPAAVRCTCGFVSWNLAEEGKTT